MMHLIHNYICRQENVEPDLLFAGTQERIPAQTRQLVMAFAMRYGIGSSQAAKFYGLDHATANHARKTVENLCFGDRYFRDKIERYDRELREIEGIKVIVMTLKDEINELDRQVVSMEFRVSNLRHTINELKNKV
jgi:hypothetical protein